VSHPRSAVTITLALIAGSLIGALAFYALGAWAFEPLAVPLLDWLGLPTDPESLRARIPDDTLYWSIFAIAALPLPIQIATFGAGVADANIALFLAVIAASRALRFGGLAILALGTGPYLRRVGIGWVFGAAAVAMGLWLATRLV